MKDRLIELLKQINFEYSEVCVACAEDGYKCPPSLEEFFADYLLESEVVVPPVRIGQEVYTNYAMQGWYFRNNNKPYSAKIVFIGLNNSEEMGGGYFNIAYENKGYMMQFKFSDIGKTIFLTKEQAEKAIANMKGGE